MGQSTFNWDDLLALITRDQRVVPVIGPDLLTLPNEGGVPCDRFLARQLAERFGFQTSTGASLGDVVLALLAQGHRRGELTVELHAIHRDFLATLTPGGLPEALRLLAEVRDFPLIVSTSIDGLLAASLRDARERAPGLLAANLGAFVDLPRNWLQGPKPTIYQLFGQIGATPGFALTEEDTLEFLAQLQSDARRPECLFDELRTRHLLVLATQLSDGLMRLLLRTLRGARLSDDTGMTITLVAPDARRDPALVPFLRGVNPRTWIYEDGDTLSFVRELRRRWHAAHDDQWSTRGMSDHSPIEPDDMPGGAVFLSYARADRSAAERIAATLDAEGLDVWFDRNEKPAGERYASRIRQHIHQCDLFLPLLSRQTAAQPDGFFRKEWEWAAERNEQLEGGTRFVVPISVDPESTPDPTGQLPLPLQRFEIGSAPGGEPTPELLLACILAVRQIRSRRTA
jgi:TIR domain